MIKRALSALALLALSTQAASAQSVGGAPAPTVATSQPSAPTPEARPVRADGNLISTLKSDGRFSILLKGFENTNLVKLVETQPNLTLFAPTDAAFATIPETALQKLMSDKQSLQKLLAHHLINARIDSSKIQDTKGPVTSVSGDPLILDGTGSDLQVSGVKIVQNDIRTTNGILHVIDAVLDPLDGT